MVKVICYWKTATLLGSVTVLMDLKHRMHFVYYNKVFSVRSQ